MVEERRMAVVQTLDWSKILTRGLTAGILGGVLIDAFLYAVAIVPHHAALSALWQYEASAALGKAALADPGLAWVGLLVHFFFAAAWGCAFSYVAHTRPQVVAHQYLSGIVFGTVVLIVMSVVAMALNLPVPITVVSLSAGFCAFALFFGLPVSLIVARAIRT